MNGRITLTGNTMQAAAQNPGNQRIPTLVTLNIASRLAGPPALSGGFDDASWEGAAETSHFYDPECVPPRLARSHTVLKAGYDREGVYLSVRCHDDRAGAIRASVTEQGSADLWLDDCVEVYFAGPERPAACRQFVCNALGTQARNDWCERGNLEPGDPASGWRAVARRDDRGWTAQFFFSFDMLGVGLQDRAGACCRFAVKRHVYSGRDLSAVSAPGAGIATPAALGWLVLLDTAETQAVDSMLERIADRLPDNSLIAFDEEQWGWKQGGQVRTLKPTAAAQQMADALTANITDSRTKGSRSAPAADLAEQRLAASTSPADGPAARVLTDLRQVEHTLEHRYLAAQHGEVCRMPGRRFGYFAWPTVARLDDGTLVAACSGLRSEHICPFGKTVIFMSTDDGATWASPRIVNDSPIDDRDAGIVNLGGDRLLLAWFTWAGRKVDCVPWSNAEERAMWQKVYATWTDEVLEQHLGSWCRVSEDRGASWGAPIRVPVSAPHGPICLTSGELLYLGKDARAMQSGGIVAARSGDGGRTWEVVGEVPPLPGTHPGNYHEPHVVELSSGRLIGMIRIQNRKDGGDELGALGIPSFSMLQTVSDDGGRTWSTPRPLGFHGAPPHLLRHSSGVLVLSYSHRLPAYGQRVAFSCDDGNTWEHDWILRDDGPGGGRSWTAFRGAPPHLSADGVQTIPTEESAAPREEDWILRDNAAGDLGYPATVELDDGGLVTVYYQQAAAGEKCSLLCSRWRLPELAMSCDG